MATTLNATQELRALGPPPEGLARSVLALQARVTTLELQVAYLQDQLADRDGVPYIIRAHRPAPPSLESLT
jgi:hypothetical protein